MNEDFSSIFEKLNIDPNNISPDMINNLIGILNSNKSENTSSNDMNFDGIDIETILKIKSAMEKMNSANNPRNNLLLALKPYLNNEKQDKLNQYIKMGKLFDVLPYLGGFINKDG